MTQPEHDEGRPRQDGPIASISNQSQYPIDALHCAYLAGHERGFSEGMRCASVDLARSWLHDNARRWTEQAVATAAAHHGDGWADDIERAAVAL